MFPFYFQPPRAVIKTSLNPGRPGAPPPRRGVPRQWLINLDFTSSLYCFDLIKISQSAAVVHYRSNDELGE